MLDVQKAMEPGAPQLHEAYPNNILKHTSIRKGNYEEAIKEPGLIKVEAGTIRLLCSTATLKTTAASPMRRTAASRWCPPHRSPILSAVWWGRRWAARGAISGW